MPIQTFETLVLRQLKTAVGAVLAAQPVLPISVKARGGAEISDYLEDQFVATASCAGGFFRQAEGAPKGATKHPWDARAFVPLGAHREEIWIDFKAIKVTSQDSNPDIGTPNKVFDHIKNGAYYLAYVYVYYEEAADGLRFVSNADGEMVRAYFLKDISATFRRNPKNQLQVNVSAPLHPRSREGFIRDLIDKIRESHQRQIEISMRALRQLDAQLDDLVAANARSEAQLRAELRASGMLDE